MTPEINAYVRTPRFLNVRLNAIFADKEEAMLAGYTEPTYYKGDFEVRGKHIGHNCMVFAAILK